MLKAEDFKWPFNELEDKKISQVSLSLLLSDSNKKTQINDMQLEILSLKLASEPQQMLWDQYWDEFSALIPDKNLLANKLQGIYLICSLPLIRARIQNKLIKILELQSKTVNVSVSSSTNHSNGTNTKNSIKVESNNTNNSNLHIKSVKCDLCNRKFKDENAKKQHYKAFHKKK